MVFIEVIPYSIASFAESSWDDSFSLRKTSWPILLFRCLLWHKINTTVHLLFCSWFNCIQLQVNDNSAANGPSGSTKACDDASEDDDELDMDELKELEASLSKKSLQILEFGTQYLFLRATFLHVHFKVTLEALTCANLIMVASRRLCSSSS